MTTLDAYVKRELLDKETPEGINFIWVNYFRNKPVLSAVLPGDMWKNLLDKTSKYPTMIYPLPMDAGGHMMVFGRFDVEKKMINFTYLSTIKSLGELAAPFLVVQFFTDLQESKGLVLMKGDYQKQSVDSNQSLFLVNLWQVFLLSPSFFPHLVQFNTEPTKFDVNKLIQTVEKGI
ncbi:hypothetical protein PROFUN_05897 [Planoprotostelium fungivorum]|uniref:Uncharacterized protein n=1 Tax=Planoprotostelium fungivorum TaxID=1890364 RepID=A0A2P6NKY1_9EUKA|nr:hypothetical protein PROFUN_05897 [Planoprotostelium fungivorum]